MCLSKPEPVHGNIDPLPSLPERGEHSVISRHDKIFLVKQASQEEKESVASQKIDDQRKIDEIKRSLGITSERRKVVFLERLPRVGNSINLCQLEKI
jgi:hypothetical protein